MELILAIGIEGLCICWGKDCIAELHTSLLLKNTTVIWGGLCTYHDTHVEVREQAEASPSTL